MKFTKKLVLVLCLMFLTVFTVESILPENYAIISVAEAAAKIKLNKKKATIGVGEKLQLTVTGTDEKVKWSSSDKSVATVSKSGLVKGKNTGTATITAKVGKKKLTCKVTVKKVVLTAEQKEIEIMEGQNSFVKIIYTEPGTVTWYSIDKSIVSCEWQRKWTNHNTVTKLFIYGHKPGTATITVKAKPQNKSVKIRVTVKADTRWDVESATEMLNYQKYALEDFGDAEDYAMKAFTNNDNYYNIRARSELTDAYTDLVKCINLAATKDDLVSNGKSFKGLLDETLTLYQGIGSSLKDMDLWKAIMDTENKFLEAMNVFAENLKTITGT